MRVQCTRLQPARSSVAASLLSGRIVICGLAIMASHASFQLAMWPVTKLLCTTGPGKSCPRDAGPGLRLSGAVIALLEYRSENNIQWSWL